MSPLILIAAAVGAFMLLGKKKAPAPAAAQVKIPTPVGPVGMTLPNTGQGQPSAKNQPTSPPATVPPVLIPLPKVTLPTSSDYPQNPGTDTSITLTESEQYDLQAYTNDALYNEAMASNHPAFVAAAAAKLAESGDTRAGDLTLRVANWNS